MIKIKTKFNKDLRKIKFSLPVDFLKLRENIQKNYNLNEEEFDVYYIDEEKDKITIGNTQDLNLAIEESNTSTLKVYVRKTTKGNGKSNNEENITDSQQQEHAESNEENKQSKMRNISRKKLKDEELIKIQKNTDKLDLDDLTPKPYSFNDHSNPLPYQPYHEDTKPIIQLQKPIQQINQPTQTVQPFISFSSNQSYQNLPEDTKPIMKLTKPTQQNNQPVQQKQENNQTVQPFISFSSNQAFQDYPEDTKPIMKLTRPIQQNNQQNNQPVQQKQETNQTVQPFISFSSNKPYQDYPEDTKPIMKLTRPIQQNNQQNNQPVQQKQESNQSTQTVQPFISFSSNQAFQDYPEDTKPIMKLTRPNPPKQEVFPYENQLKDILVLGFKDDQHLRSILLKNNGNVQQTIVEVMN